jgi:hypothetical protein
VLQLTFKCSKLGARDRIAGRFSKLRKPDSSSRSKSSETTQFALWRICDATNVYAESGTLSPSSVLFL